MIRCLVYVKYVNLRAELRGVHILTVPLSSMSILGRNATQLNLGPTWQARTPYISTSTSHHLFTPTIFGRLELFGSLNTVPKLRYFRTKNQKPFFRVASAKHSLAKHNPACQEICLGCRGGPPRPLLHLARRNLSLHQYQRESKQRARCQHLVIVWRIPQTRRARE